MLLSGVFKRVSASRDRIVNAFKKARDWVIDARHGYYWFRLKNGIETTVNRIPDSRNLKMKVKISAGHMLDPEGVNGVAHLLEHMIMYQNSNVFEAHYNEFRRRGGIDEWVTKDNFTEFDFKLPYSKENEGFLYQFVSDIIFNLDIDPEQFKKERDIVFDAERNSRHDENVNIAAFCLQAHCWEHPYAWSFHQTLATEQRITMKDLQNFHEQYYVGRNTKISIAGPTRLRKALPGIYKSFQSVVRGERAPYKPRIRPYTPVDLRFSGNQNFKNTHYAIGFSYQEVIHNYQIENVLNAYVGNRLSRFGRGLEERIAYDFFVGKHWTYGDNCIYMFHGDVRLEESHRILPTVARVLNEIANGNIDQCAFEAAKNSQLVKNDEDFDAKKKNMRPSKRNLSYARRVDDIENVTKDDLQELVQHMMTYKKPSIVTMGDARYIQSVEEFEGMLDISFQALPIYTALNTMGHNQVELEPCV